MNKKISFFSTSFTGGAGIAAKRIYDGLLSYPADFQLFNLTNFQPLQSNGIEKWKQKIKTSLYYRNVERNLAGRPTGLELFSPATLQHKTPLHNIYQNPKQQTILHLHWINSLLDFPSFFASIPDTIPIVWTLHDFNSFTGGCHYPNICRNFEKDCIQCPQLGTEGKANYAYQNQQIKANCLKNKNLHIISPSNYLLEEAKKSSVFQNVKSFNKISYGIDLQDYKPIAKQDCKKILAIETSDFVIAFGAERLDTERKGVKFLWEALHILVQKNIPITLLLFGKNFHLPKEFENRVRICYVGEVNKSVLQRIIYSAADIFVLPSLEDNQPLTCIEAMSCGTPVVAFGVGGLPEMVKDNETGWTTKVANSTDLADKIAFFYNNPTQREKIGIQARNFAIQEFEITQQAQKHWNLYETLW
jgi:glycosyltransferase involved in cell wall biosynthesis